MPRRPAPVSALVSAPAPRRAVLLLAAAATACLVAACRRATPSGPAPDAGPVVLRDDSADLLLTWVDDLGDVRVETRPGDVPERFRDVVRVSGARIEEDPESVLVADLRVRAPDGSYPLRRVPRQDLERLVGARRAAGGPSAPGSAKGGPGRGRQRGPVVIYGASWCQPCHHAAAHLRRRGVAFVEHDIEDDPAAAKEMRDKLQRAGKRGGGIPVIDVGGVLLVGFDASALDAALEG